MTSLTEQLDRWFDTRANLRTHRGLRCRPVDRLGEERAAMAPLPGDARPDLDPRIVLRVPPDPHVRVDSNDYSLDPRQVGRRVEVRIGQVAPLVPDLTSWPARTRAATHATARSATSSTCGC